MRAAFDVWNGTGKLSLGDAFAVLDSNALRAIGGLFCAFAEGSVGVDEWLKKWLPQPSETQHGTAG